MEKPHAVMIPFPSPGHINPMLQLAKVLHFKGFHITFINTEFSYHCMLKSAAPDVLRGPSDFRLETIPDGLSPSDRESPEYSTKFYLSTKINSVAPLRELLSELNNSSRTPPITCIIFNWLMTFSLDVAEQLGIPALVFCTMSACGFMGALHLGELVQRGYIPLKDKSCITNGYLDTIIDWIPGMKGIRLGDISSFVRTVDRDDMFLNFEKETASNALRAWGLILNTFDHMECDVLRAMKHMFPQMYALGPLPALLNRLTEKQRNPICLSLWKEDSSCMEWLNTQRDSSVIYVNFGSLTVMTTQQLVEFAWGLAESKHPFLWIIRPDLVAGGLAALPEEFITETKGRSLLASWCSQEEVLSHSSIGGFLTHSGWNSTLESVCSGVPMICWPSFAEQYTNCRYACKEWGIGMEIDQEVKREQVKGLIKELMEGDRGQEVRKSVMKWKEMAKQATSQGGSSYANMERLIIDLNPEKIAA
ncbi:7-deoxyloganetin glucosyltransferase-like isoform X1 [Phoenix dactylifera]|uniref:Glycosyltransferase n=1 Tax=Phoenix dactylifera TaxID=42345 RepID=A0A8B8ZKF8_PHODC|nr:7-deoxyloganetin glucosyltransferase-like isoform X1 [Phoenix dactylifera]